MKLVILADDLTGAADSAVPFATRGLATTVSLSANVPMDTDILSIDTETRAMSLIRAAQATARIVDQFAPIAPLFKKVDSTLRGYLGPECAAALTAYRRAVPNAKLLVAPAFPLMNRTTIDGQQLVHGKPIGHIPTLLARAGLKIGVVNARRTPPSDVDAWVCNAATEDELRSWVRPEILEQRPLFAGTAGLARVLAESFETESRPLIPKVSGPILFVVGSAASVAHAQVNALHVLRTSDPQQLDASQDAIICSPSPGENELDAKVSRSLAANLGSVATRYAALFLTGGATARAVLDTMGVKQLRLLGELEPGVPVSITDAGTLIITKAGAFGDEQTLERCRRALKS